MNLSDKGYYLVFLDKQNKDSFVLYVLNTNSMKVELTREY